MTVDHIECEHERVLCSVEEGDDTDVVGSDNHGDTAQYQDEAKLCVYKCEGLS